MGPWPDGGVVPARRSWGVRASDREEPNVTMPTNADETVLISADGYERRSRELDALRDESRRELGERLREARQDGDLDDNPALQELLEEQAQLERRIALLEAQLSLAKIVAPATDGRAGIGSVVRVRDHDGDTFEYELVGPLESDPDNGRVSIVAPLGEALVSRRAGARVEVAAPTGRLPLEIVSVRPLPLARQAA
jgi:transcription elongation factor GreA